MPIETTNFGEYSVKNIKSFQGREGYGFNCNLYRGKKKIAFCYDDASGGEVRIDWLTGGYNGGEEGRLLREHLASLPPVESEFDPNRPLRIDEGWFITDCVSQWERDRDLRKMRKQCQTKTLFRLRGQGRGQYHILNVPCNEQTRNYLRQRHGEDVTEIFNDVLAEGNVPSVLQ